MRCSFYILPLQQSGLLAPVQILKASPGLKMEKQSNTEMILTTIVELSERTKITAHPGDKWKAGYATLSRVAQNKSGWRNVHISKRSFEKLAEHLPSLDEALKEKSTQYQLMLTRKQHVLTTCFQREGKEPIHYVSFMHPTEERDFLNGVEEVNHAKTINVTEEEFAKLKSHLDLLLKVVKSKNATAESEESPMLDGFRWLFRQSGERSTKIFPSEQCCLEDARQHFRQQNPKPLGCAFETLYDFTPMQVQRPSKLELIEHVAYCMILQNLESMCANVDDGPPCAEDVDMAIAHLDKAMLSAFAKKLMLQLKYRQVYLASELVQVFLYVQGLEKLKNVIVKHHQPGCGQLYTRLLDHCFCQACEEMK